MATIELVYEIPSLSAIIMKETKQNSGSAIVEPFYIME